MSALPPKADIPKRDGLWIKQIGEGDYFICLDRDSAKAMHVALNIILKVAIGDRTQKWHFECQKVLGVIMSASANGGIGCRLNPNIVLRRPVTALMARIEHTSWLDKQ
jgi:hypothetical protein